MVREASDSAQPLSRPRPGRVYAFLVIALATIVVGLTVGALSVAAGRDVNPSATSTLASIGWTRQELYVLFASAFGLGLVGAVLVGLGRRSHSSSSGIEPQRVAGVTGLPVIGQLFPLQVSTSGKSRFAWIVFPAELILIAAVLLSFHASVTKPKIAREFTQNPFVAYQQSLQGWHAQIVSLRDR
jgi:hypothetical protein